MKKNQLRQLIREVLKEYETSEIIPGITINDEGEYDIQYGMGLDLYDNYLRGKTTVGDLVSALKIKADVSGKELSDREAINIAFAIDSKYSKTYSKGSKGKRF